MLVLTLPYTIDDASGTRIDGSTLFGAVGELIVYTGLMFSIVWKPFDMTAELKNWVFE